MALLSRKVDYALLILSYLHHRPGGRLRPGDRRPVRAQEGVRGERPEAAVPARVGGAAIAASAAAMCSPGRPPRSSWPNCST